MLIYFTVRETKKDDSTIIKQCCDNDQIVTTIEAASATRYPLTSNIAMQA